MRAQKARLCPYLYVCARLALEGEYAQRMRRRSVSQRDRKIYGLDADMPQRIRRFIRPGATETAVLETAVSAVCRDAPDRSVLKTGLLISLDVQGLAGSERRSRRGPPIDICRSKCQTPTMVERYVKLFKNGRNQAVRIPREFGLPGQNAIIRKEGPRLIIEPVPPRSLLAVLKTLGPDEKFPPIQDPPVEPLDL
jgi:antitoxin VapB